MMFLVNLLLSLAAVVAGSTMMFVTWGFATQEGNYWLASVAAAFSLTFFAASFAPFVFLSND